MKKNKKTIIFTIIAVLLIIVVPISIYTIGFKDNNQLNIKEKEWLDNNKTNIINVNVANNLNVFESNGEGVTNEFFDDLAKNYNIKINKNTVDYKTNSGLGLTVSESKPSEGLPFFQDHYVIVSKTKELINTADDLTNKKIGCFSEGLSYFSKGYKVSSTFTSYESKNELFNALKEDTVDYILVPLNENIDKILEDGYVINYHLSDMTIYYYLHFGSDETLNSIITKYYNEWYKNKFESSYYTNLYNIFTDKLNLSGVDTDKLTSKTYSLGFVEQTPYTGVSGKKYGGIIFRYLEDFNKLVNTEFTYTTYKDSTSLIKSYNKKDLDLIITDSSDISEEYSIRFNLPSKYYIVSHLEDNLVVNNLTYINDKVYVIKNTKLANYLEDKVQVETVKNEKALIKAYKKGNLIAIDANAYDYYYSSRIKESRISFTGYNSSNYEFKYQSNDDAFSKLFTNYLSFLDDNKMIDEGILDYNSAAAKDSILGTFAKYFLTGLSIAVVVIGITIYSKKHIKLNTKIRKDEKLKFVDMLTSLKNRNYLNEKIDSWNQNTIYPQAIIVIDLNNLKYINDTFGHEEGDRQIKSSAGILIKTQLDNTEIMRTDGNEFMVYLVGYNEKQVINYIKKLLKEFKNLPYEYGAAIGFSMIVDDLKLIDDAINEASIQMRENKEQIEAENEKES